jgi:hypothetical protein
MTFFLFLAVTVYGGLLRLYPREFQLEFRGEMQGVFESAVKEAIRTGRLALLQLFFFEMVDFPVNLVIEHVSQWRKEWSMKDTRHRIRPSRSAAMGALGLGIGNLIAILGYTYTYLIFPRWYYRTDFGALINNLRDLIPPPALASAFTSALLGLMLCLSISASARITLRACLLMAGFEVVAVLVYHLITRYTSLQSIFSNQFQSLNGYWDDIALALWGAIIILPDGLFTGAGLGLATGGWKSCWRTALKGMLAYGFGMAVGLMFYQLWLSSGKLIGVTTHPMLVISNCISGIISGGILGWLWGREREAGSTRVVEGDLVGSKA